MIPKIDPGILGSVRHEINNSWIIDKFEKIKDYDPVMGELLSEIGKRLGMDALGKAILVYRLIESQIEANNLEGMFQWLK